jgi:hypothetical protein
MNMKNLFSPTQVELTVPAGFGLQRMSGTPHAITDKPRSAIMQEIQ